MFLQTQEVNLSANGATTTGHSHSVCLDNTQVNGTWYMCGRDTSVRRKTYISTLAKTLGVSAIAAGMYVWLKKGSSSK